MVNIQSFWSINACDRALPWIDHISQRAEHPAILTNDESPPRNAVGPGKDKLTSVRGTLFTKSQKLCETFFVRIFNVYSMFNTKHDTLTRCENRNAENH